MKLVRSLFMAVVFILASPERASADSTWVNQAIEVKASRQILNKAHPLVVAIIDTGLDLHRASLAGAVWKNPGETGLDLAGRSKESNGIDDDANGFVDDVSGWNFAQHNSNLFDEHGHGTHIAGLIGAQNSSDAALNGVAPGVQIMVLKYYDADSTGSEQISALVAAIRYATMMHADLINYSGGGPYPDARERLAIELAGRQGILLVAAAGNERSNSDRSAFYPADYGLSNVVSVGAHTKLSLRVPSSNFGLHSVDLFAPGEKIESTLPMGARGIMTGTSQATAFVTGALALLKSQRPDLKDPAQIIRHLRRSSEWTPALAGLSRSGGRLNLLKILALQDPGRSFSGYQIERPGPERKISSRDRD